MTRATQFSLVTIAVGIVVLGMKYVGYLLTGSIALYSDALESIVNVATAVITLIAVSVSAIPADTNHPYGHNKAEYLSAVLESTLILVAAFTILREAYEGFMHPRPLETPLLGTAVNLAATLINGLWGAMLIRHGRRWHSPALVADGRHLWTDVVSSIGVAIGVALVALTGWQRLDAIIAGLVALHILWSGWRLMRDSVGGLMDEALPVEIVDGIRQVIRNAGGGALQANTLRSRRSGARVFIEFNLVVPGDMPVAAAHAICDRLEAAIQDYVEGSAIVIHLEPEQQAVATPDVRIG
ncbi:cation-efflux pump [Pigmentiphaga sp. NML080357]|uniref:cation diffusion facilitator family transporter n=1 Tax=Pigmentiphaga sp. NML080357 TaxID=2008675 RepID=UPI000B41E591|nr:cation diffusion facilitator family transporter [Pigmentiphaga sp. NML080357]OVZ60703.1 cation-efflux pump [Pigmentiphaga sp. NML080357]